ncbi:chromosome segregation protein [Nitzschia inconspicua]|uniref:Chromosome segregation protein n=1 Tax=Nitzschia inconspicua TaxID=303405 RepID=A0A9K3PRK1_9STRA|nr:chromosome segregation protein [Nitzschia inconspicua]
MVSPLMNFARSGDRRNKRSPVGMTVVSPSESVSPLDSRMTPTRKMLFQRRRLSSQSRNGASPLEPVQIVEDENRDNVSIVSDHMRPSSAHRRSNDKQMQHLYDRFNHIQQGLGTIDEERNELLERTKKLEKEKKLIQKQLELREREILTLVKRCASQEEKMRESSKLRSENRELQHHLDSVKRRLNEIDDGNEDLYSLKKKLQQSELDREHLQDRLSKLQREHDSVTDTLQECLANIRQLTDEKQQIEEERRRERRRAELELEKQHLAHVADSNNLKEDIQIHQSKILQLEKILQDNMYTNTALRREKALLSQGRHGEVQEVIERYERQLLEMREIIDNSARGRDEDYERELSRMKEQIEDAVKEQERLKAQIRSGQRPDNSNIDFEKEMQVLKEKLEARDNLIENLESEFSGQMEELMSKQSSLDQVEEERRILEEKLNSMRNLETEHAALLDFVQILDSNLAELTSENAHLILEKETIEEEAEGLRKHAETLQNQLKSLRANRKARESDFRDLLEAEKHELRAELEEALLSAKKEVAALRADLDTRGEWICMLESELRISRREILEKEKEILKIGNEMQQLRSNLTAALRKARAEIVSLESEVFCQDQNVASIEGRLDIAKEALEGVARLIDSASVVADAAKGQVKDSITQGADLANEDSMDGHFDLELKLQEVRNEVIVLQKEVQSLTSEKQNLSKEVETSRGVINGRDDQIVALQDTILQYKKRERDIEKKLLGMRNGINAKASDIDSCNDLLTMTSSRIESLACNDNVKAESGEVVHNYQQQVEMLEKDLVAAEKQKGELVKKLEEKQECIRTLDAKLSGNERDERDLFLEGQLKEAYAQLGVCHQQSELIEVEHAANLLVQSTNESNFKEMQNQIKVLEQQIQDLEAEVRASKEELALQNKITSELKSRVSECEEEKMVVLSRLDEKQGSFDRLQNELTSKNQEVVELQTELQNTQVVILERDNRVSELESVQAENSRALKRLNEEISDACIKIKALEESKQSTYSDTVEGEKTSVQTKTEIKELEERIQILLASQTELATELEKSSQTLEQERLAWSTKEDSFEDEFQSLKAELVSVQGKLTEREVRIKKLELDLEKNDEMYKGLEETLEQAHKTIESLMEQRREINEKCLSLETQLSETRNSHEEKYASLEAQHHQSIELLGEKDRLIDTLNEREKENVLKSASLEAHLTDAQNEIQKLELEIKSREEHIQKLQQEIKNLTSSEIEISFVESEKRMGSLESQLAKVTAKNEELKKCPDTLQTRLLEVDEKLELAQHDIVQKNDDIKSRDMKCNELKKKVEELNEILSSREQRLMTVESEIEFMKRGSHEYNKKLQDLERLNKSLEEALTRTNEELLQEKNRVKILEQTAQNGSEEFYDDKSAAEHKIRTLEDALQKEIQSRNGLELDVVAVSETLAATQRRNAELERKLEEKCQALNIAKEELLEAKTSRSTPSFTETQHGESLEAQLAKLTTELALRDDEIRELRLVELNDAEETITSLREEINYLTEEALQKNLAYTLQQQSQVQQFNMHSEAMAKTINSLESSKRTLESTIEELHDAICIRDDTIKSLRETLSQVEQREMEMADERILLRAAEEEGREEVENLKDEIKLAITREKEMAEIKLRNKDALHKEEVDHILQQLEATKKKLRESEGMLEMRSNLLGEMVDQNKELECKLEKEETDLQKLESKFSEGQLELERSKKDLKKCQEDLRRKESKLKEERENKEFAEESLRKLKAKYNEAIKTRKCVTDLERQNAELRDKILRQEAFLHRKLEKEKIERGRLTPTKGIAGISPSKNAISTRTPTRQDGSSGSAGGRFPPPGSSNAFTVPPRGSKLPGPSKSAVKKTLSPSSRSNVRESGIPTTSDRSVTSELSSLLRTPIHSNDQRDDSPVVPGWEMELK